MANKTNDKIRFEFIKPYLKKYSKNSLKPIIKSSINSKTNTLLKTASLMLIVNLKSRKNSPNKQITTIIRNRDSSSILKMTMRIIT